MDYESWAPIYRRIRDEFGFPAEKERESADLLLEMLPRSARADPLGRIRPRLHGREVIVVGLAPGYGPPPVWTLPRSERAPALIAADGAAAVCLDAGLVPDVITTDLDGPVPSEVVANSRGAFVLIHAHGDNAPAVERWTGEFSGEVGGSWAGPPEPGLLDVGGFTDGDRAVFLAEHLGALRIVLWAFDRSRLSPGEGDPARKRLKLEWADRVIADLARASSTPIVRWRMDGRFEPYEGESGKTTQ